tara:strand:- start:2274 stop:3368 length:1095 start_codon:yes stop_codon:yes gene_type:complete
MSKNQRINQVEPLVTKKDARAVYDYLTSGGWVTEHNVTREFEKQVKNYVGRKYAVAVPNGTIAIYLALISAGIKKGDRVAVPNLTMIATVNAVIWAGATPVLIDVDKELNMSYEKLINVKNLKAVIFVPLNGRTSNGLEIERWCKKNKILLIEDSAHALGSRYSNGKHCGNLGDLSVFSFTPHKIITTGQGGMVLTNSKKFEKELVKVKTFNRSKDKSDWHEGFGLNFKITDLQSTLGLSQFSTIEKRIKDKKRIHKLISTLNSEYFEVGSFKNYELPWFIDIFAKTKKDLKNIQDILIKNNIETRMGYPALSKQKYLKDILRTELSYSEKIHEKILWLPSSTDLSRDSIERILKILKIYGDNK